MVRGQDYSREIIALCLNTVMRILFTVDNYELVRFPMQLFNLQADGKALSFIKVPHGKRR